MNVGFLSISTSAGGVEYLLGRWFGLVWDGAGSHLVGQPEVNPTKLLGHRETNPVGLTLGHELFLSLWRDKLITKNSYGRTGAAIGTLRLQKVA